jgi:hypothetical protein
MPAPKRLLVLATETTTAASGYVAAADKLGLEIVFGTEEPGAPLELQFDQRDSALRIVQYAMERPLAAIVTVDNAPAAVAGRAASMLGLPYHPPRAGDTLRDRKRLEIRLSGAGLEVCCNRASQDQRSEASARYAIAGVMTLGHLRIPAIFDATGAAAAPLRLDAATQQPITDTLRAIIRGVGLRHGPVYVELAREQAAESQKPAVAEVAAAIPARYAAALRFRIPLVDEDVSLEELLIRNALGMDISRVYRK